MLGFYLSGHPLQAYKKELENRVQSIASLIELSTGDRAKVAGVISNLKRKKTRNGATMAIFQLQDETGIIDVRAFPERMDDPSVLEEDKIVIVEGTVDINEEQESVSMNAIRILPIEEINRQVRSVRFRLSKQDVENGLAEKIRQICEKYRGDKEVVLEIFDKGNFYCEIMAHSNYHVDINDEFKQELAKVLKPEQFLFE